MKEGVDFTGATKNGLSFKDLATPAHLGCGAGQL